MAELVACSEEASRQLGSYQELLPIKTVLSLGEDGCPKSLWRLFKDDQDGEGNPLDLQVGAKHAELRQRLTPLVSNNQVTDEEILGQMTKMISDENEHQRRLCQLPRQKPSHAHSAKVEADGQHDDKPRGSAADGKNLQTIQQLSAQVETLTQMVATLMDHQVSSSQMAHSLPLPAQRLGVLQQGYLTIRFDFDYGSFDSSIL